MSPTNNVAASASASGAGRADGARVGRRAPRDGARAHARGPRNFDCQECTDGRGRPFARIAAIVSTRGRWEAVMRAVLPFHAWLLVRMIAECSCGGGAASMSTSSSTLSLLPRRKSSKPADVVQVQPTAPVLVVSGLAEDEKHAQVDGQLWFPALLYRLVGTQAGTNHLLLSFKTDCDCAELPIDTGMNGRDFVSLDSGLHWSEVQRLGRTNEATGLVRPCMMVDSQGKSACLTRTVHSHTPLARSPDNRTAYLAAQVFDSSSGDQLALFNASLRFPFELSAYSRPGAAFTYSLGTDGNTLR
eukprot:COSAG02_NODE_985_length_15457_cov_108.738247_12_plen_302_part_00